MKWIARLLLVVLIAATPCLAAKRDGANITLSTSVHVASFNLRAGDYRVTWVGSGPEVQVSFQQYGKILATVPAKLIDADNEATIGRMENPFELQTRQKDGSTVLVGIQLPKVNLVFVDALPTGH